MDVINHKVFNILGMPIRDTVIHTWIMILLILTVTLLLRKKMPHMLETTLEAIYGIIGGVLNTDNLIPYIPVLGTLFLFVLIANTMSIIPGLISPTADVNTTFALAMIIFFSVHFYGIRQKGLWGYLKSFSDPVWLFPLELLGHFSRTLSLTLRLFGNIMSGDLIVAIVFSLIPIIVPIPMMAISLVSGVLQAFIMTTLASLYISSAIEMSEVPQKKKKSKSSYA